LEEYKIRHGEKETPNKTAEITEMLTRNWLAEKEILRKESLRDVKYDGNIIYGINWATGIQQ